ncbi:MAG TPA: L-threonylcarbamoyladenylate synthase [Pyrinomonadaceae bacterium]|nr:L-threonylcarbamoyladenylate synthase [Pyrinomonadaceae bacterium]
MKTVYTTDPAEAAEFIKCGGVVAFPTETVYGLGANVLDAAAVERIFEAKKRPGDNPLIVHVANMQQVHEVACEITVAGRALIERFWPGPLTVILPKHARVPDVASAGLTTIGVRMPRLPLALSFIEAAGVPIAAPSANLSGRPSPTTWEAVAEDLDGRIDCILEGPATEVGLESTVVDCTTNVPAILRAGSITIEHLREVVSSAKASTDTTQAERSPGTRHQHYKPAANLVLIEHPDSVEKAAGTAYIGLARSRTPFDHQMVVADVEEYARKLYEFLRESDRRGIRTIYCQEVAPSGLGTALMDRLRRAAN